MNATIYRIAKTKTPAKNMRAEKWGSAERTIGDDLKSPDAVTPASEGSNPSSPDPV